MPQAALAPRSSYTPVASSLFGPSTYSAPSSIQSYRDRARELLGSAEKKAKSKYASAKSSLMTSASGDTIGGVVASATAPFVAMTVVSGIDASVLGTKFREFVRGMIEPSTALFLLGGLVRWAGWDKKWPKLRAANTALLRGGLAVGGFKLGTRIAQSSIFHTKVAGAGGVAGALPQATTVAGSTTTVAGSTTAAPADAKVQEPIPGEVTRA